MGFWTNLFSKSKENELSSDKKELSNSTDSVESVVEMKLDDKGWFIYPDGVKIKINFDESQSPNSVEKELGYNIHELYYTSHNSEGKGIEERVGIEDLDTGIYWELFTDKLVAITRKDDHILTKDEINECKRYHKKHIQESFEMPGMESNAFMTLEQGIDQKDIRQIFIENIYNKKSENNYLSVDKYEFFFNKGYLVDLIHDGYSVKAWSCFYRHGVEDYYNVYKQMGVVSDNRIKKLTNKQAECYLKIDDAILKSIPILNQFCYDGITFNYIAIAAFYKQCDVSESLFIESTLGYFVFLSKTEENGVTTKVLSAYNNTIAFYDGHSLPIQNKNEITNNRIDDNSVNIKIGTGTALAGAALAYQLSKDHEPKERYDFTNDSSDILEEEIYDSEIDGIEDVDYDNSGYADDLAAYDDFMASSDMDDN